ncbi:hypothetical protein [Thermomonospora umbrina]|uniref:DNA-directed RNA polymerase specialized sigma24 family protein n=1 Tax=Thermomonospora umbrina TaxID=111806 RepID=A0A3D9SQW5_9ACTN|nr:hypothetical protein [Thermomonospora umbrina]REE94994.1 hypothetical protein DFJ69_0364 [Thermomonospora umbrina]
MPQKAPPAAVLERRYRDLVRLAYLVLPGKGKRIYRMAVAQRIVDGEFPLVGNRAARPGGRYSYARTRTRVLRRAMRPSWRLRIGLGPWLRGLPTALPDPALTLALSELEAPVRVAYVLREVERMPRYAVRDQLVELGVTDVPAVLEVAEAVGGVAEPSERCAGMPEDVSVRQAYDRAVRRRTRLPIAVATALTVGLGGTVFVMETGGAPAPAEARQGRLVTAPVRDWARAPRTLDVWPARGELAGDRLFTGRALATWSQGAGRGTNPQLLFAGRIKGVPTALLRHGDRVARYTEPARTLETLPSAGRDATMPLALGKGYYLLPPWTTQAHAPDGERAGLDDGAAGPFTVDTSCGRGPLLRLTDAEGSAMLAQLGGPVPASVSYRPSTGPEPRPVTPDSAGLRVWKRLSCALPAASRPVTRAVAWEFWAGRLPEQARPARWVCTRFTYADGGTSARATLIEPGGRHHDAGVCDAERPVSGLWWRSPAERWYYVAAGAPGLVPHAEGPVRRAGVNDGLLVATGPRPKRRPTAPVTLTARTS